MTRSPQNRKISRLLALLFSIGVVLPVFSQFEAQFSQYMFHIPAYNPASIGESGMINVTGQYRMQNIGLPGAPQTLYFSANAPIRANNKVSNAFGVRFLRDGIGSLVNQNFHLQYAYKRKIGKNTLSVGADVGFVSVGFVYDSIRNEVNSDYHNLAGDAAIPTSNQNGMSFDASLGAFYAAPKYYLGISYVHLNVPRVKLNDDRTQFKIRSVVYATGGYDFSLGESKWTLRSNALAKSDFASWQAEISARMEYDQRFWSGLSYRFQDAAVVFAGIQLQNGMMIGFSYDVPISALKVSPGSPEVVLSYNFLLDTGNKGRYKSIRIL